jgi:hypothetical protein
MTIQVGDTVFLCYKNRIVETKVNSMENGWVRVRDSRFAFRLPELSCHIRDENRPSLHRTRKAAEVAQEARNGKPQAMVKRSVVTQMCSGADLDLLNFMRGF